MDVIAGLLDGPRARRAFLLRCTLDPPWSLRIEDEAPLSVVAVLRGGAWFAFDGRPAHSLGAGDVALLRGPDHYLFADDPATPPQAVIHPGQVCTTPDGQEIPQLRSLGIRRWGNAADGGTEILTGTYNLEGEVSRRLLDALPQQLVLRADEWHTPVLGLLADEVPRGDVGQDAVLDRLLDLLLIHAVRAYFARGAADAPGWFRGQADPVVGHALRLLHDHPAEAWTLASLARQTSVARATLARRFASVVGQPPMEYLTEWRLMLAADLILDPAETLESVAAKVGYGSGYALSAAFKRVRGVRPGQYRKAERLRARA
ncbi:MAG TPA: AraC family transcriptional regulator [Trebonia sp.]|nr:AraC family transcriptional regulator [Trebonia sp.]